MIAAVRAAPALRAVHATFVRGGETLVAPFSVEVAPGECASLAFPTARAASIAARMAAGIVKATSGTLLVCEFDPRIQPVQAKRQTGYVPRNGNFQDAFVSYRAAAKDERERCATIDLHAALFEVTRKAARRRVAEVLETLGRRNEETFALALALIRPVSLLVLDSPVAITLEDARRVLSAKTAVLRTLLAHSAVLAAR